MLLDDDYLAEVSLAEVSRRHKPIPRWMRWAERWTFDTSTGLIRMPWNHAKTLGLSYRRIVRAAPAAALVSSASG